MLPLRSMCVGTRALVSTRRFVGRVGWKWKRIDTCISRYLLCVYIKLHLNVYYPYFLWHLWHVIQIIYCECNQFHQKEWDIINIVCGGSLLLIVVNASKMCPATWPRWGPDFESIKFPRWWWRGSAQNTRDQALKRSVGSLSITWWWKSIILNKNLNTEEI